MNQQRRGYSWLDNGSFVKERVLLQILLNDKETELCTKGIGGLIFNTGKMMNILESTSKINMALAILCHCLPGQPSRISEFVEHKIRNSTRPRTFFRLHGSDWLVTRRVKYENLIRLDVFIPSKLPPELQALLDFYLLVVRPLEIDLARQLWGMDVAVLYHEYLWLQYEKRMSENQFSRCFGLVSQELFRCDLTPRPYRQIVVEIARIYLGSEYEIYLEDQEEDDALAEQAGHSIRQRRGTYAQEIGLLPEISSDLLLRFGHVSEWWWRLTGFLPDASPLLPLNRRQRIRKEMRTQFSEPPTLQSPATGTSPVQMDKIIEHISAVLTTSLSDMKNNLQDSIQAAVAAGLAEMMSRQPSSFGQCALPPATHQSNSEPRQPTILSSTMLPDEFHSSSLSRNRFTTVLEDHPEPQQSTIPYSSTPLLDFPHSPPTHSSTPVHFNTESNTQSMMVTSSPSMQSSPHCTLSQMFDGDEDIDLKLLQKLFPANPYPQFRSSEQRQVVRLALERQRNFVGIIPTGGGKSLVFLLPALLEDDTITLVVVPSRALLVDMLRKTKDFGIPACRWTAKYQQIDDSRIVYIALESVTSLTFRE
jgi:Superfamily II DNA helicase